MKFFKLELPKVFITNQIRANHADRCLDDQVVGWLLSMLFNDQQKFNEKGGLKGDYQTTDQATHVVAGT